MREFLKFEEARKFVRALKLTSYPEWRSYVKGILKDKGQFPPNIPKTPDTYYQDNGWKGFADFLGYEGVRSFKPSPRKSYLKFKQARAFVLKLKLESFDEWREFSRGDLPIKRPENIPSAPNRIYKNKGWSNWGDWLGTGRVLTRKGNYLSQNQAKDIIQPLNLKSIKEFKLWYKKNKPKNIPQAPNGVYKDCGWSNWGDFLGPALPASNCDRFLSFVEAREFVRGLKLNNQREWVSFCAGNLTQKRPRNIPAAPENIYNEFLGYGDWLGTGNAASKKKDFLPFKEAREIVRKQFLKDTKDWNLWSKTERPKNIPANPLGYYDKEWQGIKDWLGTN